MLDMISNGFKKATESLTGRSTLTEENLAPALEEIRRSLLDADVEYSVVKNFLKNVKTACLGEQVQLRAGKGDKKVKVSAREHFVKICQDKLEELMGPVDTALELPKGKVSTIMMVGLQGSGKTTSTGKLALFLQQNEKRKPLLVAADIYRPAAVDQLHVLGERLSIPVFHLKDQSPQQICHKAIDKAHELGCDTVLLDTAGRLTIDAALMQELQEIKSTVSPDHTFFVCDAMMGQDAVTTAKAFHEQLSLSGVIMTKLDGDARGGAALSIKEVTGAPLKFLGMGEELEALEVFRPEGLASRILGMGDVVGLMQDFEKVASEDHEKDAERALSGKFNFQDFYNQIETIQKMGPLKEVMAKLPMQNMLPQGAMDNVDEKRLFHVRCIINSMTQKERLDPDL
ncbi:MAG: signal recognition particle receptor subunit alpha, partial [Zetaproteobacteria bacterium]|nr:signal recognition particle receptor subunit alpha [Zetaproteobacteria bacterium]